MPTADPSTYGSSWYAATAVASPPRGRLAVELDVDVCVVGAGLAGLTVAREVARRGWSVVVLEAQRVASNASGRNAGFVQPGFSADPQTVIARVGLDRTKALWALSGAGAEYVRNTIRETGMPGVDLNEDGWLHVSKSDARFPDGWHTNFLRRELGAEIEAWPAERVRAALKSPLYFGGLHYPRGFSIHPLNYALGLAAAAEALGVRICEETPALEIDPAGVRKRVSTPNARVRAGHVVLAGNVNIGRLMPRLAGTLLPVSNYVITTAPLGEPLDEAVQYAGAVSDTELADNHYRIVDGDRLLWSGRSTVWRGNPKRYVEALIGNIARAYPQLGWVRAEYAWTGTLGDTVHGMPQIGEFSPGVWLLSGFGGHGINATAMGGELIARAIVEGDQTWRLFLPFELVWAGGVFGRAVVQTSYWKARTRERIAGRIARKRDEAQRHDARRLRAAAGDVVEEQAPAAAEPAPAVAEPEAPAAQSAPPALAPKPRRPRRRAASPPATDAAPPLDSPPPPEAPDSSDKAPVDKN